MGTRSLRRNTALIDPEDTNSQDLEPRIVLEDPMKPALPSILSLLKDQNLRIILGNYSLLSFQVSCSLARLDYSNFSWLTTTYSCRPLLWKLWSYYLPIRRSGQEESDFPLQVKMVSLIQIPTCFSLCAWSLTSLCHAIQQVSVWQCRSQGFLPCWSSCFSSRVYKIDLVLPNSIRSACQPILSYVGSFLLIAGIPCYSFFFLTDDDVGSCARTSM